MEPVDRVKQLQTLVRETHKLLTVYGKVLRRYFSIYGEIAHIEAVVLEVDGLLRQWLFLASLKDGKLAGIRFESFFGCTMEVLGQIRSFGGIWESLGLGHKDMSKMP